MKNKKLIYVIFCAIGSAVLGFCANKLNSFFGGLVFSIGIIIMVFSIMKISNEK